MQIILNWANRTSEPYESPAIYKFYVFMSKHLLDITVTSLVNQYASVKTVLDITRRYVVEITLYLLYI